MKTIIIAAMTLCGRISPAPLGSPADRALLIKMRDETDASLIGAATLHSENPKLLGNSKARRLRAVITGSGNIPLAGKAFFKQQPAPIIFTNADRAASLEQSHGNHATIVPLPRRESSLDLQAAVAYLSRQGARSLLIEGGGRLNFLALQHGVVDEVMVTITPQISGHDQAASLAQGQAGISQAAFQLKLLNCTTTESGEIFSHYKVET